MDINALEESLSTVRYRTGELKATRKDFDGPLTPPEDPTPVKFNFDFRINQSTEHIRVDLKLGADTFYADYSVIMSGIWSADENSPLPESIDEEVLGDAVRDLFAPRILAVATAKINDLARLIDCPTLNFDYSIDRTIKTASFVRSER